MSSLERKRALIVGHPYHGARLAGLIEGYGAGWRARYVHGGRSGTLQALFAIARASAVICIGGPAPHSAICDVAQRRGIGILVVWTGADLARMRGKPDELALARTRGLVHLADAPWLVDELRDLGIAASYVPVTAATTQELVELPERFGVLSHVPHVPEALPAHRVLLATARALPDVSFSVVGRGTRNAAAPKNVAFLGYVERLDACIDAHCAVMRFSAHDGASPFILEALARGRHAIWNYPFEGVRCARTLTQVVDSIAELYAAHERGSLESNEIGRRAVASHFAPESLAAGIERELDAAHDAAARRSSAPRRVAVSGSQARMAGFISHLHASEHAWEVRPMRTRARLTTLAALATLGDAQLWYSIGPPENAWLDLFARMMRKPRVIHWCESDARRLCTREHPRASIEGPRTLHLADALDTAALLRSHGITARVVPPPHGAPDRAAALPDIFTVLFAPSEEAGSDEELLAYERILRACAALPMRVLILGERSVRVPSGTVAERLSWRDDLYDAFARSTVLVRIARDDGIEPVILEALAHRRHVIWSKPFPYVREAHTAREACAELEILYRLHIAGSLHLLDDAAAFVRSSYDPAECAERLVRAWEEAAGPAR